MRFLGIDFGIKRIGIAVSDESGTLAFPREVFSNDIRIYEKLEKIINDDNIDEIVIGKSQDSKGNDNIVAEEIKEFSINLENKFELPVREQNEFFTSMHAHGTKGKEVNNARITFFKKPKALDASAAALILQRYLDKLNK